MPSSTPRKGGHTPEADAKRAESMRKRFEDPEYRARHAEKIREAKARMSAERKSEAARKSHTAESDEKRREAMRRKWDDPEYQVKRAALERTPEMKAARSKAMKIANNDPGKRQQHSDAMREKFASDEEYRTKHLRGLQASWQNPEVAALRAEAMRKAWQENPEQFHSSLEALLAASQTPQFKAAKSAAMKKLWEEGVLKAPIIGRGKPPTSLELIVATQLAGWGVVYLTRFSIGRYELDIFVPRLNLDIEADGEYWHSEKNFPDRPTHDARRDKFLESQGIRVLRLAEKEIKDGSFVSKLQEALK